MQEAGISVVRLGESTWRGTNDQGKTIRYYLNYSDKEVSVVYDYSKEMNLLLNSSIVKGTKIVLKPWDAAIIEE